MKVITLYRRDFLRPYDGDGDHFNSIIIGLGLVVNDDEAFEIDEIEIVVHQATAIT